MKRHWSHDPAKHRAALIGRATRADIWLAALAILSLFWPLFWLIASLSRAIALDGSV